MLSIFGKSLIPGVSAQPAFLACTSSDQGHGPVIDKSAFKLTTTFIPKVQVAPSLALEPETLVDFALQFNKMVVE